MFNRRGKTYQPHGIYYATPNRDFAESANVTFENNIANIALAGGNVYTHTWEANTYAVLDNIYIREGTLTLSPGAVLKFAENKSLFFLAERIHFPD